MTSKENSEKTASGGSRRSSRKKGEKNFLPDFNWGEVDDVQQREDELILPSKKVKRRPAKYPEKIESTLTVVNPQADLYRKKAVKRKRPTSGSVPPEIASAAINDPELTIPSYGKQLQEIDDDYEFFLRNAEESQRRKEAKAEARKRTSDGSTLGKTAERMKPSSEEKEAPSEKRNEGQNVRRRPAPKPAGDSRRESFADRRGENSADERDLRVRRSAGEEGRDDRNNHEAKQPRETASPRQDRSQSEDGPKQEKESRTEPGRGAVSGQVSYDGRLSTIRRKAAGRLPKMGFAPEEVRRLTSERIGVNEALALIDFLLDAPLSLGERPSEGTENERVKRPERSERPERKESSRLETDREEKPKLPADRRQDFAEELEKQEHPESRPSKSSGQPAKREEKPDRAGREKLDRRDEGRTESRANGATDERKPTSKPKISPASPRGTDSASAGRENAVTSDISAVSDAPLSFGEIKLSRPMLEMLRDAAYLEPTPIQAGTIPRIQAGVDVMGQSKTGSGKTAAFMIPIIEKIEECEPGNDPVALIVVPTRELAVQIRDETVKLSRNREIVTVACYGGKPIVDQIKKMAGGVDIVIGTPGRLLDLTKRRALSLSRLQWVVLDEADRMLDIGFRPDIERILKMTPESRQTLLFSATLDDPVVRLAKRYMKDPEIFDFSENEISSETIEQFYITVDRERKYDALLRLLQQEKPTQAIVFCRTKRMVDKLGRGLGHELGKEVGLIHGDLSQPQRDQIMRAFRNGDVKILVATDVVGRGIDISGISHIFNYDIPQYCDDYIHRVGRTGRMGREGVAFTLVTSQEGGELTRIEMRINRLLKRVELEGFEAFTRPDDSDAEKEEKEHKAVFGKSTRRVRRAL